MVKIRLEKSGDKIDREKELFILVSKYLSYSKYNVNAFSSLVISLNVFAFYISLYTYIAKF